MATGIRRGRVTSDPTSSDVSAGVCLVSPDKTPCLTPRLTYPKGLLKGKVSPFLQYLEQISPTTHHVKRVL